MKVTYICPKCGIANVITSFWRWFRAPHFGAKKRIVCDCCGKRSYMPRYDGVRFFDLPYNKYPKIYRVTLRNERNNASIFYLVDAPNKRIAKWSGANLYNHEYAGFKRASDMSVRREKYNNN